MIFDDVGGMEPVIDEYFSRGRHCNCNMIFVKQNIFSADRQNVREDCNLCIFFEQRGSATTAIYHDFFSRIELSYNVFRSIRENLWAEPYNYIVIDKTKSKNFDCKLGINRDLRIL